MRLKDTDAVTNIAVKELSTARRFYGEILGLSELDSMGDMITFRSGHSKLNVYRSDYAGTNQATAMTWDVGGDLEDLVAELKEKNVKFEHYDLPNTELQGDIHVTSGMKIAWFKDPDGNILNLAGA